MDRAGKLSKGVKRRGGQQIQDELSQFGQQSSGTALITSGGNLPAPNIIHLIPDNNNKDHLQQCVERCLQLAETQSLRSISIPAVGTGAYGMSAVDSASLIFKALTNFSASFRTLRKVRIVIFEAPMLMAFQQAHQRYPFSSHAGVSQRMHFHCPFKVEVTNGDLTQESSTEAIMNIISTDMNMNNAGDLSKAIARQSGPQVQQECNQLGKQSPGTAVLTKGGNLQVPHIIHIIPGSSDKKHLQQCLEEGLRVADSNNFQAISIPCVGTGGYGLTGADSAQLTFKALNAFSVRCKSIQKVRVVVFQVSMMQEFLQEQKKQPVQDIEEEDSDSENAAARPTRRLRRRQAPAQDNEHFVKISVIGKDKLSVGKAVESLKKGFSDACTMEKVESEVVSQLSDKQRDILRKKSKDRDVKLEIEDDVDRIVVRGEPAEVSGMVGEIWKEINERTKKKQEEEQAKLVSKNVEWSYELRGTKMAFAPKANAKIELAYSKEEFQALVVQRLDNAIYWKNFYPGDGTARFAIDYPLDSDLSTLRAIVQKCLQTGETLGANSIAFPVIGTGNLHFPRDTASRIMLDETVNFCRTNPASNLRDIRFVVFNQDQTLTAAFKQEMDKLQPQLTGHSAIASVARGIRSFFGRKKTAGTSGVGIEVLQGDLCQETSDAIVNITSKDLNMDSAGKLSKEVKRRGGQQIQDELNQFGQQSSGTALITSGGNLPAPNIIHLIPDNNNKDHLQQCVERCLQLAETQSLRSISIPAVGTGAYGMSAVDSASFIFKALTNFSASFRTLRKVRIVIFEAPMLLAFQQAHQRYPFSSHAGVSQRMHFHCPFKVEVTNGDLTQESSTEAIMNIISTDMNMNNAGDLSKAIARQSGPQVQQECNQLGKQSPGTAVLTKGGNLQVPHIIHIIPGSSDKKHLQQCLEEGLRVADSNNFQAISIPCVGTGGYGLTGADSAQLTFKALNAFSVRCKSIQKVRVVVFQASMMHEFLQEQKKQPAQDIEEEDSDSENVAARPTRRLRRRQAPTQGNERFVKVSVIGKDKFSVGKAVESLKKSFSDSCTIEKVESEVVSQLSDKQKDFLRKKAKDRDVELKIEDDVDRIVVRGEPTEVSGMVGEIWKEINERTKKKQEEEQAKLVSKNIEWSYEIHGAKMAFAPKANGKIELAHSKDEPTVQVSLRRDKFIIDLKRNSGRGQTSGEQITLSRKVKGADEGIALPKHWAPMPRPDMTVHTVQLLPGSTEYQDVVNKFQVTARGVTITKIERVQNPHLYQAYLVRKRKMDKDTGGNSERQLFHGTSSKNIKSINAQGLNRSFAGVNGVALGRGVYFARDASYSIGYARGSGTRHMYLARVLVGQYCQGNSSMIVPPAKNSARPEILYESVVDNPANPAAFVVFYDNQCYPEYLITFQ
ncbi:poly [ADP-ribose] polymerase 14-like [Stylophora pistillata]|uniref:poly [ADP-ribose] polymerase 14-like n=1 Tax=Stylophora pistillata TaxID=50429 RepID=UPI000C03C357|nr:poly [ADP-ribose] polymerase 14-like [Stylophora pistillata]